MGHAGPDDGTLRAWRPACVATLLYALLACWTLAPVLSGERVLSPAGFFSRGGPFPAPVRELVPPGVDILSDAARQFEPWLEYAAQRRALDGTLPLWKDTASCGAPLVGNGQSGLFFPTRFAALLLGAPATAYAVFALLKLLVAALGGWALARHLRASATAAFVTGLVFGFGGFQSVFRLHPHTDASMLLPWLVLAADRLAQAPSARRVGALALVAGLQDLAGHPQTALHGQLAALVVLAARAWSLRAQGRLAARVACGPAALLLGAAAAALQLLPLAEYTALSEALQLRGERLAFPARGHLPEALALAGGLALAAFALWWLSPARRSWWPGLLLLPGCGAVYVAWLQIGGTRPPLPLLLAADWYGSAVGYMGPVNYVEGNGAYVGAALPLAAAGLLLGRPRGAARLAGALAVLGVLAGMRAPLVLDALSSLPLLGLADNSRLLQVALLGLALLAGLGLDGLVTAAAGARARLAVLLLAPVAALLAVQLWGVLEGTVRSSNVPAGPAAPLPESVARFGLLEQDDALLATVLRLEERDPRAALMPEPAAGEEHMPIVGYAILQDEAWGMQVLYGAGSHAVLARTALVRAPGAELPEGAPPGLSAAGDQWVYAFRASLPRAELPDEVPAVRVRASIKAGGVLLSQALVPDLPAPRVPFPARPAPGAGGTQLLLLALAALVVVAGAGAPRLARRVLPVLVAATLLPFSSALVPTLPRSLYHPPSGAFDLARRTAPQGRVLCMEPHVLSAEIPTAYGLREPRGYDALHPPRVGALLRAATDWDGTRTSMELLPARQDVDLPLLGLMAVQLLLDPQDDRPDLPRRAWRGEADLPNWDPFPIVANPAFLPRARIVGRAELLPDDEAALARLRDPAFDRAGAIVLAEADGLPPALLPPPPAALPPPGGLPPGLVEFLDERPDTLRLAVQVERPALLTLADTHFPGWECRVDGAPRPIHRANVAFRAVELRPGDEIVEFRYQPRSYAVGEIVSLVAALVLYALVTATGREPGASGG